MPQKRRAFTPEYKDEAAKMVIEASRPIAVVAREIGLNEQTLRNWVGAYRRVHAGEEPPLSVPERALRWPRRASGGRHGACDVTVRGMRDMMRRAVLWYSIRNRSRKAELIDKFIDRIGGAETLLLCGAIGVGHQPNEGVVERRIARWARRVVAFDVIPHSRAQPWPFLVADALRMPLRDQCVDLAVSNAVIEHVGGEEQQRRFVAEHCRVARAWVITTPNRWFPVESHTSTVLLHWAPRWRDGRPEFTRLLSRNEFKELLPPGTRMVGRWWSPTFTAAAFQACDQGSTPLVLSIGVLSP